MELASLAAKPKLVELVLDNSESVNARKKLMIDDLKIKLKAKDLTTTEYDKEMETVNDIKSIVDIYGESLTFWTWDRVPLDTFMKLANADENNAADMIDLVRTLLLDAKGKEILGAGQMLPTQVLTLAIAEIVGKLGKF